MCLDHSIFLLFFASEVFSFAATSKIRKALINRNAKWVDTSDACRERSTTALTNNSNWSEDPFPKATPKDAAGVYCSTCLRQQF